MNSGYYLPRLEVCKSRYDPLFELTCNTDQSGFVARLVSRALKTSSRCLSTSCPSEAGSVWAPIRIHDFPNLLNAWMPMKRTTKLLAETTARSVITVWLVTAAPLVNRDVSASVT